MAESLLDSSSLAKLDAEVSRTGDHIRDAVLEHVAYLAEREQLPATTVLLGDRPTSWYRYAMEDCQPAGWVFSDVGEIKGIYLPKESSEPETGDTRSDLVLSLGGLFRCTSYDQVGSLATRRYRSGLSSTRAREELIDTRRYRAYWPDRQPVKPEVWIQSRHLIAAELGKVGLKNEQGGAQIERAMPVTSLQSDSISRLLG